MKRYTVISVLLVALVLGVVLFLVLEMSSGTDILNIPGEYFLSIKIVPTFIGLFIKRPEHQLASIILLIIPIISVISGIVFIIKRDMKTLIIMAISISMLFVNQYLILKAIMGI